MVTDGVDAILWWFLEADILEAEAAEPLPSPPLVPVFARETERPGRPS